MMRPEEISESWISHKPVLVEFFFVPEALLLCKKKYKQDKILIPGRRYRSRNFPLVPSSTYVRFRKPSKHSSVVSHLVCE